MKNTHNDTDAIHMPPDLLAQARQAASEEHRPADELVSEAVRRYLESRRTSGSKEHTDEAPRKNLAQFLMESPFAGSDLDLERQQDYGRPLEL